MPTLTVEQKVAQLFIVGSDVATLDEDIDFFRRVGLGGLLLFRHHLQGFETLHAVRDSLTELKQSIGGSGLSFISIDQEGGQVERLPHWLFPTGILPVALSAVHPGLCERVNRETARRLRWAGINVNFTPTVDLNTERQNPIIGVRAYGETPEAILPYARAVVRAHLASGVLPVVKHFPGHGSGTVDSHASLPRFERWHESELAPYEQLQREDLLPAVLVAHGLYPQLMRRLGGDPEVPASLSPTIMTDLLRKQMRFDGLVYTDDLMMGAVWGDQDPVEVALQALAAGADQLVYRRGQPEAILAFEKIVSRVKSGKISESLLDEKLSRLWACRDRLAAVPMPEIDSDELTEAATHELSFAWAQNALTERHHQFISPLPLSEKTRWLLIAPDRHSVRHYGPDVGRGGALLDYCAQYGLTPSAHVEYPTQPEAQFALTPWPGESFDVIVFIAFNALFSPAQQAAWQALRAAHPEAKFILASAAMPTDADVLPGAWIHIQLPTFRPAGQQALAQWLATPPQNLS